MFIELPNDIRVNSDHIINYILQENIIIIYTSSTECRIKLTHDSVEGAKQTQIALDRAIGIKPLMIRK